MTLTGVDLLGHFSFLLTGLAYFMRDMILLRVLSIASGVMGIVFNFLIPEGPLWLVIFWITVFLAVNAARLIALYIERRNISFSEEEQELYRTIFHRFNSVEFLKLMRMGEWGTAKPGVEVATQGEALHDLKLIYNGEVVVEQDGNEVVHSRDGTLVGEMSFIQGGNATATVRALRPTRYVSWPKEELRKLLKRNPTMDLAMQTVFSVDLMHKLTGGSAAPRPETA
ncbi:MAG: cyclic nucleotide-binding domain-containing protein [Nitrospinota bacterium]|jgi:hypothetical protein|nr:cyclic nucleotide-binding domain-containing protein [Nitrospinota bacterium]